MQRYPTTAEELQQLVECRFKHKHQARRFLCIGKRSHLPREPGRLDTRIEQHTALATLLRLATYAKIGKGPTVEALPAEPPDQGVTHRLVGAHDVDLPMRPRAALGVIGRGSGRMAKGLERGHMGFEARGWPRDSCAESYEGTRPQSPELALDSPFCIGSPAPCGHSTNM